MILIPVTCNTFPASAALPFEGQASLHAPMQNYFLSSPVSFSSPIILSNPEKVTGEVRWGRNTVVFSLGLKERGERDWEKKVETQSECVSPFFPSLFLLSLLLSEF